MSAWEETPDMLAEARMVVACELEVGKADREAFDLPVVAPPERMLDFQREWTRRPGFRALIRAAGRYSEEEVAHSRTVRGLWEMSRSKAWTLGGGKFPFAGEFAALG